MKNTLNHWQERNEQYLCVALNWLRLRLTRLAESLSTKDRLSTKKEMKETEIVKAAAALIDLEAANPPPALVILSRRLGLSRFEQEVMLLCAAMELDTRVPGLCARASL